VGEDKSGGHVSVGGVGGRGVHCRGRDGGGQERNSTDISIFRALSFPIYFLYPATPPVLIRFFLALILIRTNAITHPHSSSPNPSILLRPLQIPDPVLPFAFPFLTSLSALFPHVCPTHLSSTEPLLLSSPVRSVDRLHLSSADPGSHSMVKPSPEPRVCNRDALLSNANSNSPQLSQSFTAHYNNRYQKNWTAYVFDQSVPEYPASLQKRRTERISPSASGWPDAWFRSQTSAHSHQPILV
jgi:hypothetical protein